MAPDVAGLPWPEGDPGGLRAATAWLSRAASSVRSTGTRFVTTARGVDVWSGLASAAYFSGVAEYAATFSRASGALTSAAGALDDLAAQVEEAQEKVRELARKVEAAEEAAREASERAAALAAVAGAARAAASAANMTAGISPIDPGVVALNDAAADASAAAGAAGAVAAEKQREAAEVRRRAEQLAHELCLKVDAADRATAAEVRSATVAAPAGGIGRPLTGALPSSALGRVLAPTYAPVYRHDSHEDHFPADYRDSIDGVEPYMDGDTKVWPLHDSEGLRDGDLDDATLPYLFTADENGNLQLEYWRWHHFNDFPGPQRQVGPLRLSIGDFGMGSHDGDWEKFAVRLDDRGNPAAGAFAAHEGGHDTPWNEIEMEDGHPVVYVAHGGHGSYADTGTFENPESGFHDHVNGDGEEWETIDDLVDGSTDSRLHERSDWGDDDSRYGNPPTSPGDPRR